LFVMDLFAIIKLPYLWLNVIGCVLVIGIALFLEMIQSKRV